MTRSVREKPHRNLVRPVARPRLVHVRRGVLSPRMLERQEARRLAAIVKLAFESRIAKCWHNWFRMTMDSGSRRWDDGPCGEVAVAIRAFDKHRGEVRWSDDIGHVLYLRSGLLIDAYGVHRRIATAPCDWRVDGKPYPGLLKALREASRCAR